MTDSEFFAQVDNTLLQVEEYIEKLVDTLDIDADCIRSGNVLTLDFEDKGKMILNSQVSNHELWLAARSGGFHYGFKGGQWCNTRTGELFVLNFVQLLGQQLGIECPNWDVDR